MRFMDRLTREPSLSPLNRRLIEDYEEIPTPLNWKLIIAGHGIAIRGPETIGMSIGYVFFSAIFQLLPLVRLRQGTNRYLAHFHRLPWLVAQLDDFGLAPSYPGSK